MLSYSSQPEPSETVCPQTSISPRIVHPVIYASDLFSTVQVEGSNIEVFQICRTPTIRVIRNLLTDGESDELVKAIDQELFRSTVGYDSSTSVIDDTRTSSTHFFRRGETALIRNIEERISAITHVGTENIEPLQGLCYQVGQQFKAHYDFLRYEDNAAHLSGDRKYSCVIYLNDMAEDDLGGSTVFEDLGIAIRPSKGSAILWENLDEDGNPNYQTLHSGEPPEKSAKYVITAWIREKPFLAW